MCARYTLFTEDEIIEIREIIAEVEKKIYGGQKLSKGEIYPSNIAPVVTNSGAEPMKWGFPNPNGKGIVINARSETTFEKPLFRDAAAKRRCAIPATGFFEWGETAHGQLSLFNEPQKKTGKDKYLFALPDNPFFFLAGFYDMPAGFAGEHSSPLQDNDIRLPHFIILTMNANSSVSDIHDRMPVILSGNQQTAWLSNGTLDGTSPMLSKSRV